jgi:hypothetical protein
MMSDNIVARIVFVDLLMPNVGGEMIRAFSSSIDFSFSNA